MAAPTGRDRARRLWRLRQRPPLAVVAAGRAALAATTPTLVERHPTSLATDGAWRVELPADAASGGAHADRVLIEAPPPAADTLLL